MKTSKAFQIWTKCMENKWEGHRVPLGERELGILGQVWYLIVSIPDLCTITYFDCTLTKEPQNYISHFVSYVVTMFKTQQLKPYKR